MTSPTLDQHIFTGEAAFAFGCERPAVRGQYLFIGLRRVARGLLNRWCGLELKQAVHEVREHRQQWLALLTRVERWTRPYDPMLFFAVARLSVEDKDGYRAVLGAHDEIASKLSGETVAGGGFISIARVLHQLRANAAAANVELPERLTVDEDDKPAYEQWRAAIDRHRAAAGARTKALVKA